MPIFSVTIASEATHESATTAFSTKSFAEAANRIEGVYNWIASRRAPTEVDIVDEIMGMDPTSLQDKMKLITVECLTIGEAKAALRVARTEGSLKGYDASLYHPVYTAFLKTKESQLFSRKTPTEVKPAPDRA